MVLAVLIEFGRSSEGRCAVSGPTTGKVPVGDNRSPAISLFVLTCCEVMHPVLARFRNCLVFTPDTGLRSSEPPVPASVSCSQIDSTQVKKILVL